jgi:hypothetical protein
LLALLGVVIWQCSASEAAPYVPPTSGKPEVEVQLGGEASVAQPPAEQAVPPPSESIFYDNMGRSCC